MFVLGSLSSFYLLWLAFSAQVFLFQSAFVLSQGNIWEMGFFEVVYLAIAFQWEKISAPLSCGPTQLLQRKAVIGIWKRKVFSWLRFWWKLDYTAEILSWASWCDEELSFRNSFWRWQCSSLPDFYLFRSRSTNRVAGTRVVVFYKLFHELSLLTFFFKNSCRIKFENVSKNYK